MTPNAYKPNKNPSGVQGNRDEVMTLANINSLGAEPLVNLLDDRITGAVLSRENRSDSFK